MIFLSRFFDLYDHAKEEIVEIVDKTLLFFMHKLNLFHLYIVNRFGLNTTTYQFLTANDKAKNIDEYVKALNDALENNKVKNIAISGSYGSGKSSFIKTFEKNSPQYRFLDISLATFKRKGTKEGDEKTDLSLIEKSILEQMFYKVKNTTIPQSRLKKINRLKWIPIKIISVLLIVLSYFILFQPQSFKNITVLDYLLKINSNEYLKYLPVVFLIMGAYYIVNKLLIIISNTNIEKLSLQNLELKSNSDSASLLNQYLDEILYFFEQTHFDIVVFQDLDRFENLDIFTKLRELNNFVNNSEQVAKKIVFIYAVKDEMFKNAHERTKFFDFLIPIIPYINATNSKDVLLDYFEDVEKSFLYDISLYISDMRLLKNIYNEYLIYSSNLDSKLDKTKLLAMIIYKNFEPQDFEELHKCKGLVYDVFKGKKEHITLYIEEIGRNIDSLRNQIEDIENEPRKDIKELRQLYIFKIIENLNNQFGGTLYVNSKGLSVQNCIEDDNFKLIKESNNLTSKFFQQNTYHAINSSAISFKNIEQVIGNYDKREKLILDRINNKTSDLSSKIQKLKQQQEKLKDISIKELFEKFSNVTILEDKSFENKELMQYLLSYGHINENYEEYISNFFGVSITKDEQEFLQNIKKSGKAFSFDYELKNLEEIVKYRLTINEFSKESVLNLNLLNYLLENKSLYYQQIEKLFLQLSNENERSNEFIFYCLDYCNQRKEFVSLIVKFCQKFWFLLMNSRADKLITYFGWVIHYSEYENVKSLNYNGCLKEYLTNVSSIQEFSGSSANKVIQLIKDLDIKFIRLDLTNSYEIVNFIFENSYYALEPHMINKIIFSNCAPQSLVEEDLKYAHLTTIKSDKLLKGKEVLLKYINDNINEYIENIFLRIDTNTKESEEIVIELLNSETLNEDLKLKVIEKEEAKIINIDNIDKMLWEQLIRQNKVVSSWDNAFKYFNDPNTNNDLLLDYLNIEENAVKISQIQCGAEYRKNHEFFDSKLLKLIIETNRFSIVSYEHLIRNLGFWYEDLNISKLNNEKIELLIKYGRFQFKKACFDALKEKDGNLHIAFIEKNKNKLLEEFETFEFETDDIIKILEIDKGIVSDVMKKDFIEKVDYTLITNKNIAKLIYKYIDRTNIKPIEYTKPMLQNLESLESKINLIIEQNNGLDDNQFIQILDFLPEEYSKIKNFDGKQTVLKDNYYNQKFIAILKERGFITSDKPDKKDQIRLYIKAKSE